MQLWHRLTLEQKTIALFSAFILLTTLHFLSVFFFHKQLENDTEKIAVWLQEKTELKATLSKILNEEINQAQVSSTELEVKQYDHLLNVLLNGGMLPASKKVVEAATNDEAILLQNLHNRWKETYSALQVVLNAPSTKDTIIQHIEEVQISDTLDIYTTRVVSDLQSIPNPVREKSFEYLSTLAPEVISANEEYLNYLFDDHNNKKDSVIHVALMFWIATVVIFLILLFKIRTEVFSPLNKILITGEAISKGNSQARVAQEYPHELGRIVNLLNDTAETLQSATNFIQGLGQGKVDEKLLVSGDESNENTIRGALVAMQRQMQQIEKEDKERKWISEGLTKFADLLRTHNESIGMLADKITSSLVKYTGSMVGGTYLLNDQNPPELELMAFYALNTKKYNTKKFKPGEGLVGQTFLEEDYIYLLEIPENYISVTTGIGETSPKAILLVPLKVENEVFGVIELASLREYREFEIDFVKKLSESIASTIQNVKINERTKKLLEESQQMTEQMRSQEEEMRQNMEELSATQEEMSRKEQEMTARLDAIDKSLALAEYDRNKKLISFNQNFAIMHSLADKVSTSLEDIIMPSEENTFELDTLWLELLKGNTQYGYFLHKNIDGPPFKVESTYTPVRNGNGEITKIIELAKTAQETSAKLGASDVEEELRQNLEALDITQQKLSMKYDHLKKTIEALDEHAIMVETNGVGEIKGVKDNFKAVFGEKTNSILQLNGIKEEIFSTNRATGEINYNNKIYSYVMKKIDDDSYFFLLVNI